MIGNYFTELNNVTKKISESEIVTACTLIQDTVNKGKKIFTCGNGGSAYAASHYITDWNKMSLLHMGKQFKGISLCDNTGLITAFANDIDYTEIFSGQLSSLGSSDDLLIVISGSGNSKNLTKALEKAKQLGMNSLAVVGYCGGECSKIADHKVHIPSYDMQICEDIHLMFGHIVMKNLCLMEIVTQE